MKLKIKQGTTSKLVRVFVQDSAATDGSGKTGIAYNDTGLTAHYLPEGDATATAITLASGTVGTYSSGGWSEVDSTNMPGIYELGLPDAAVDATSEGSVVVMLKGAADMAPVLLEIELDAVDYKDATDFGLSNLDAAISTRSTVAATDIVSGGAITTSGGAVSNVTLVATTTTNTDMVSVAGLSTFDHTTDQVVASNMRGTDGANTIAPDNASIAAILTDTGTTIPASISALNDFDPATDQVIVSTNNDKTGYSLSSAANDAIGAAFLAYTLTKGSPGTIERAFWQSLKATQLTDGEVSGTPTASAFDTNLTAVSGAYDHLLILFTSGSLAGEARPIDSYSATNGRITLQEALTAAPSASDEFIIVPDHSHPVSEIVEGIFNEAQSGYTTPGTFGYYIDAQISGISSGGGDASEANQTTIISHLTDIKGGTFSGSTDSLEAIRDRGDAAWTTGGSSGSGLYQVTVTVEDASNNALQGARIAVDGTNLILTTPSNGQVVFNLDSGVYLLTCSPPAGYDTPTDVVVSVSTSDVTAEFTLTPTSSSSCDVPWIG